MLAIAQFTVYFTRLILFFGFLLVVLSLTNSLVLVYCHRLLLLPLLPPHHHQHQLRDRTIRKKQKLWRGKDSEKTKIAEDDSTAVAARLRRLLQKSEEDGGGKWRVENTSDVLSTKLKNCSVVVAPVDEVEEDEHEGKDDARLAVDRLGHLLRRVLQRIGERG